MVKLQRITRVDCFLSTILSARLYVTKLDTFPSYPRVLQGSQAKLKDSLKGPAGTSMLLVTAYVIF